MLTQRSGTRPRRFVGSSLSVWAPTARLSLLSLTYLLLSHPAYAQVRFDRAPGGAHVHINGKPFTTVHFGEEAGKPFLHPLLTQAGGPDPVTRGFPVDPLPGDSFDHPHHRGLVVGAERVNGQDFWDNEPGGAASGKGRIIFKELADASSGDERGILAMVSHWVSQEGRLWLVERRTLTFYTKPLDSRMFDIDIELQASEDVTFEDQESAIIGLRLALPFDTHYDGWATNAAGGVNEDGVRGRRSPWLAWTGITSGGQRMVVAVFDHPANLNHPTRWHARNNGFFMANPFGGRAFAQFDPAAADERAAYTLKRGEKLRLRYRILIYPAEREVASTVLKIADLFKEFARR